MFRSLYSKLAVGLAVLFLIVGLLFVGVTVFSTDMYQQEVNQKLNSNLAEQIVAAKILMQDGQVNETALKEIFHMLMVINPGIEIYLLDPEGSILTFSAPKGTVKRDRIDLAIVKEWLDGDRTTLHLGEDPRSIIRKKVFSAARISGKAGLEGYLYVILGGERYDSVVQKLKASYILQLSAWMISAGLLFALITGLILFALLTGRLKKLARVMDAFKRGSSARHVDYPIKQGKRSADEIDRLGTTFKEMAERIETQMEELKRSDELRRELIANVSHDLRTPLATLQGYIETLLIKENQYTEEERREYLEIAIKHCQRLSKLVSELLELAKLESSEIRLHFEPFNLSELVQDVVQKFQLRAGEKSLEIITNLRDKLPFVNADIALVERALENLIENAIHHTPAGGEITIRLALEKDMLIQIENTGPGIPEQDLPHIFKRFYHVEQSRKYREGHSGLGLAITKKIIELHQRSINVTSSTDSGTSFTFYLPIYHSK